MVELPLYKFDGTDNGQLSVSDDVFGQKMNAQVVHSVLVWYQASKRRGTQSTKTRAEVRGGGKKPWAQKGTGRARAGSIRSPLWRKGGVHFAPKPRDYGYSLPKKVRKLALKVALSDKAKDAKIKVLEEYKLAETKTKLASKLLSGLKLSGKVLVLVGQDDAVFGKAVRNMANVQVLKSQDLNIFDLLKAEWVLFDKNSISQTEEALNRAA